MSTKERVVTSTEYVRRDAIPILVALGINVNGCKDKVVVMLAFAEGEDKRELARAGRREKRVLAQLCESGFVEALVGKYWCYMCSQMMSPIMRTEIKCPFCESGFVEEMSSTNRRGGDNEIEKTNCEESLELLKTCSDSCKWSSLPLIMFHDELIALLERKSLQPAIMDWISKHTTDFESMFLSDLEHGKLLSAESYCGLEGELWMNLDGGLSPICLSILPLVSSSLQLSSSLPVLPAHFLLLSVVERLTNRGSLGGIDALLGCPLHLPSSKYFVGAAWLSMTGKQKSSMCLSLYYATNWIRELLNAFSSQVTGRVDCMSQATREEINAKLLKRLRNLVFLESLLNTFLKSYPLALPELQISTECSGSSSLGKPNSLHQVEKKNEKKANSESNSSDNKRKRKSSKELEISDKEKLKQPTILDMLRKSGAISQEELTERLTGLSNKERIVEQPECHTHASGSGLVEISAFATVLDAQRYKCRPLSVECLYILSFSKIQNSCCSDSAAELPLHLYLLRDLHQKLGYLSLQRKQFPSGYTTRVSSGLSRLTPSEFLNNIKRLFPSLKKHLDTAVCILKEDDDATYEDHWSSLSTSAGNPDIPNLVVSKFSAAGSVFKEVFFCFRKMFILPDIQTVLSDLLEAFQPMRIPDNLFSGIELPIPLPGNIDYLYCGAFSFLASVFDIACSISVVLASEVLATLESLVHSAGTIRPESNGKSIINVQRVLPSLRNQLGTSAHKLLMHNWDNENVENGLKNKGDMIQKILRIYLKNCESTEHQLEEFSCSILPQVPPCKTASTEEAAHGFPTLNPATFIVWYRVLYEEDLEILNKLVKEAALLQKSKAHAPVESVKTLLLKLNQSVNVVVSLVNMCKTREKVTVHAMAIKFGGKFVESFLKVFDFLQEQFQVHTDIIIQLVKELQKATRIIQTLCSEAKGSKRTMITTKIPAAKRSMERFLFRVKALLHNTSNGCTFWMGNLKHKDLMGQVVSSQVYTDGNDDDAKEGNADMDEDVEEQPININSEGDRETET
ncbi:hypothetical protein GIB67_031708 [Kingdonia uniflora]|uniref:RING-type E3 ubiquitin transferase n=1 Tax=Kingdonia uniflora TaxID=39325 RepID=A0A7J7NK00_9MAGN|nr:hypothetical protein GIB67_031708 [Kingdonia uniflora]